MATPGLGMNQFAGLAEYQIDPAALSVRYRGAIASVDSLFLSIPVELTHLLRGDLGLLLPVQARRVQPYVSPTSIDTTIPGFRALSLNAVRSTRDGSPGALTIPFQDALQFTDSGWVEPPALRVAEAGDFVLLENDPPPAFGPHYTAAAELLALLSAQRVDDLAPTLAERVSNIALPPGTLTPTPGDRLQHPRIRREYHTDEPAADTTRQYVERIQSEVGQYLVAPVLTITRFADSERLRRSLSITTFLVPVRDALAPRRRAISAHELHHVTGGSDQYPQFTLDGPLRHLLTELGSVSAPDSSLLIQDVPVLAVLGLLRHTRHPDYPKLRHGDSSGPPKAKCWVVACNTGEITISDIANSGLCRSPNNALLRELNLIVSGFWVRDTVLHRPGWTPPTWHELLLDDGVHSGWSDMSFYIPGRKRILSVFPRSIEDGSAHSVMNTLPYHALLAQKLTSLETTLGGFYQETDVTRTQSGSLERESTLLYEAEDINDINLVAGTQFKANYRRLLQIAQMGPQFDAVRGRLSVLRTNVSLEAQRRQNGLLVALTSILSVLTGVLVAVEVRPLVGAPTALAIAIVPGAAVAALLFVAIRR